MHESSLQYIRCVKCGHSLEMEIFEKKTEVVEGLLYCTSCGGKYPIILSIPIMVEDLSSFFSIRTKLGGYILLHVHSQKIKSLVRKSLQNIKKIGDDTTDLEKNWVSIYKKSRHSVFEKKMTKIVQGLAKCDFVMEHGCSIGTMAGIIAKRHGTIFGIDKSFFALLEAKKHKAKNMDFFLADSLSKPFGSMKFDLVVALNVLELIEPLQFLKTIGMQSRRFLLLSDPYDYERGKSSVKTRLDGKTLRTKLKQMRFKLICGTGKPSFISWKLNVNSRLELSYMVDLILAVILSKGRIK
ncbi:MAG: methyltransferase domain-containing protein [Thaumarchaeota archaeon]|nr:methyltransferase domain-containing protein [Nitrososphaerota archaeon]